MADGNITVEVSTRDAKKRLLYLHRENARLRRRIYAGECSLLPTPCASDAKRWPGSPDHPRLQRARGLRLQEELGARPGPEIVEWMMGFPPGWTDCGSSGTLWSRQSENESAEP